MHLMADIFQAHALEEPSPEVFLQPRNFNPHPYELGYDPRSGDRQVSRLREYANQIDVFGADDRGPILFPANNQPGDNRVTTDPYVVAQLKDTHPYAGVAAKKKKKYGIPVSFRISANTNYICIQARKHFRVNLRCCNLKL